jgi:GNAT superfamily N-acetyltransferase
MEESGIRIREISGRQAMALISPLADILIDCVAGGASVSFLAPLARDKAENFWRHVATSVGRDERVLLIAEDSDDTLIGTAQLVLDLPENQPHRAEVAKVLVPRSARRRGVGAALMRAIEDAARDHGRSLLALDTTSGREGDRLYERLGWTRFGIMPGHALTPDGSPSDTAYFYKKIAQGAAQG